ncbi:hypothetical protein [Hyphobacterium lacteum]|nr:hypothetical protein [Hyphobacterium sp. HN65]
MAAGLLSACATTAEPDMASDEMPDAAGPRYVDQGEVGRPDPDDLVCRYESPTGTRMRERICRTQAEWDAIQEAGQDRLRHRQATGYQRY